MHMNYCAWQTCIRYCPHTLRFKLTAKDCQFTFIHLEQSKVYRSNTYKRRWPRQLEYLSPKDKSLILDLQDRPKSRTFTLIWSASFPIFHLCHLSIFLIRIQICLWTPRYTKSLVANHICKCTDSVDLYPVFQSDVDVRVFASALLGYNTTSAEPLGVANWHPFNHGRPRWI